MSCEDVLVERGSGTMSVLDVLRKGFGYVLMSMGVSSPAPKKQAPKPAQKPGPDSKPGS